METKNLICITCPLGCRLCVCLKNGVITDITGNSCPRGAEYARRELLSPSRIVTSTVAVKGGSFRRLPVKTSREIPREKIMECMDQIRSLCVQAPVHIGDVLISDAAGTGIPVVATKNIDRK